ncbi:MAG: hypothetical protein AB8B62_14145 [Roseobacter sp.]
MAGDRFAQAVDRLNTIPSAISQALALRRDQADDLLLVNVGGSTKPYPFAKKLFEDMQVI